MACYYIKQSIFQARNTRAETIIIIIVCIVASATAITRITRLESNSDPKNFILNAYTQYVVTLFNQKKKIYFNYSNKKTSLDCYKLNYHLSPNFTKKELAHCLNFEPNFTEGIANMEFAITEDSDKPIIYYPFLNKLRIMRN